MCERSKFTIISGPCSLESSMQIERFIQEFPDNRHLRAGIFKMRTDPSSFQGLGIEGVKIIQGLKERHNIQMVTEVTSRSTLESLDPVVDIFQVGTRNMYNYDLLKDLSSSGKTIILKRAMSATIKEWLKAAEYISSDPSKVWLCERGIRTFEDSYRNTMDLNAISYIKNNTDYKILVDPSHGTGVNYMVKDLSLAAMAVGADGLLIESHEKPSEAKSDGHQALTYPELRDLIQELKRLAPHFNRELEL